MWFDMTRYWYRTSFHWLTYLLRPFAFLYGLLVMVRCVLYRIGIFKTYHFSVPIIVVGNITVGGTGKTPFVIWLAHFLRSHGYQPGIVSRGVGGRKHKTAYWVSSHASVKEVGDEAWLLAKNTHCPVVIGVNRPLAVQALLQQTRCNVVISDDGLQHYALARDIEIVMVDSVRRFGNTYLLPAGPLREPISRLRSVDFIIVNGETTEDVYSMSLIPGHLISVCCPELTRPLNLFSRVTVHAVAAIGHPERFFQALRTAGVEIIPHIFSDHHLYCANDFNFQDTLPIIMTEKDAVKCLDFADERYWYWPVTAVLSHAFERDMLSSLTKKKECSLEENYL
jgi:tetraacyldisaccharide 4'-kinase